MSLAELPRPQNTIPTDNRSLELAEYDLDLDAMSGPELVLHQLTLNRLRSELAALEMASLAACAKRNVHRGSPAASVQKLIAYHDKCDPRPIGGRLKAGVFLTEHMPAVLRALRNGRLFEDHARLIANTCNRAHYRNLATDSQEMMVGWARSMEWADFVEAMNMWLVIHDPRDPADIEARAFDDRYLNNSKVGDTASFGIGTTGLLHDQILEAIRPRYDKFFKADWDEAKARVGESVTLSDLLRTDQQRWHDAFVFTIRAGAKAENPTASFVTNLVIDEATLEHEAAKFAHKAAGGEPDEAPERVIDEDMILSYRSETLSGTHVSPSLILQLAMRATVRSHIIKTRNGDVVSSERTSRFFNANSKLAMTIRDRTCRGAGCCRPAAGGQADHRKPHHEGGPTSITNGDMLCPACHRHKSMLEVYGLKPKPFG